MIVLTSKLSREEIWHTSRDFDLPYGRYSRVDLMIRCLPDGVNLENLTGIRQIEIPQIPFDGYEQPKIKNFIPSFESFKKRAGGVLLEKYNIRMDQIPKDFIKKWNQLTGQNVSFITR